MSLGTRQSIETPVMLILALLAHAGYARELHVSVNGNDSPCPQVLLDLRQQHAQQRGSSRPIEAFDSDEDHGGSGRAIEKQKVCKVMIERHDGPPLARRRDEDLGVRCRRQPNVGNMSHVPAEQPEVRRRAPWQACVEQQRCHAAVRSRAMTRPSTDAAA